MPLERPEKPADALYNLWSYIPCLNIFRSSCPCFWPFLLMRVCSMNGMTTPGESSTSSITGADPLAWRAMTIKTVEGSPTIASVGALAPIARPPAVIKPWIKEVH